MDLLSKIMNNNSEKPIEPREIFMTLPNKSSKYEYPRDVQTEVWRKWFEHRNEKNIIIKMNTGSGKTIVGLMALQSCLNEGKGPAVYVVPDKYLVSQVINEAESIGIRTTKERDDYYYSNNKAILVTTIHALFNGQSVFGIKENSYYPIESVLIDDVHSCIDIIDEQFSLKIPSQHELYGKVLNILKPSLKPYNSKSFGNICDNYDPYERLVVPFWIWHKYQENIYSELYMYYNDNNDFIYFSLPLLEKCFSMCNCIITASCIEITPKGNMVSLIRSFENAQRRIFMSATLADDSVFVSGLGLHPEDIKAVITPEKANDIGTRLILFPRHLNRTISDDEIRAKVYELSKQYNCVVIVPSKERAKKWQVYGEDIIVAEKGTIDSVVQRIKSHHIGLVVFVNRYNGIDLPDDACRLLVIDSLPPLASEYKKYVQSIDRNNEELIREQIQRIEQGMGRGVRSNGDFCCIILMGDCLADYIIRRKGINYFSKATQEQYRLSSEMWNALLENNPCPSTDQIFDLAKYSLENDQRWFEYNKSKLLNVNYDSTPSFDNNTVTLRCAFESYLINRTEQSQQIIEKAINLESNLETKGYLKQMLADYIDYQNPIEAQKILLSARTLNMGTLVPIDVVDYKKKTLPSFRAKEIIRWISSQKLDHNGFMIFIDSLLSDLSFDSDPDRFESAVKDMGNLVGFASSRPDKETSGKGCDNLWEIATNKYLVIECKNCVGTETICKHDVGQLLESLAWFANEYGDMNERIPVFIHRSNKLHEKASAHEEIRVINEESLNKLKSCFRQFALTISRIGNWLNEEKINEALVTFELMHFDIRKFSVKCI